MRRTPSRAPRAALITHAASLEHELAKVLDITNKRLQEANDMGLKIPAEKLAWRIEMLEQARQRVNQARQLVYDAL